MLSRKWRRIYTESEGSVYVSVNRHDMMLYVHDVYTMLEPRTLVTVTVVLATPVSEVSQIVHVLPTFIFICMLSGVVGGRGGD